MEKVLVVFLQKFLVILGSFVVSIVSYIVFAFLDLLDPVLCVVYKVIDYLVEAEWKSCYCFSAQEDCSSKRQILVNSLEGKTEIVCHCLTKVQMEDISDTLYSRKPIFRELVVCFKKLRFLRAHDEEGQDSMKLTQRIRETASVKSTFCVNSSTIVESLQCNNNNNKRQKLEPPLNPRWSDCDCTTCASWHSSCKETLYVTVEGPRFDDSNDNNQPTTASPDVIFIHGFISSSTFWTETVFPNLSESAKSSYRLFAVDLLGFGRSPKPIDSLYTLTEHVDMIERSVLRPYRVRSFHVVAHSLGCIIALALAARFPGAVRSLTLIAPPYFPVPRGVKGSQFVLRQLAPRRVWPLIAFGSSIASWYEHVSRTVCLLICKHHRLWDFIAKQITRNRIRTFLIDGFMCHTHHSAWHTLHNVICGTASKMEDYLEMVKKQADCKVTVFHGRDDELLPAHCSVAVKSRIPRAHLKIIDNTDHITIVVGRQKVFARELEEIWAEK